jgi:adenine-specific DNA-methyltransferase
MAKKKTRKKSTKKKDVVTLTHDEASRKNIPTAEFQSVMAKDDQSPIRVAYERRNRDLDPQLVWRGKDEQDWSDLVTHAPPLFIQEKVHPKVLIDDLLRRTQADEKAADPQMDLFADFNGLPDTDVKTEFYQHDANWTNRMILGDSLQVMASLAEREGLRGQVQCIYIDPPYGIKFNSNFQWSTTSRTATDGKIEHITREPEQVRAFRDTWRDGVHSYLTYMRDRFTVARDLLSETGSVFVQIGDENVHLVRGILDEVFGASNFHAQINFKSTSALGQKGLRQAYDYILWYTKNADLMKFRGLFRPRDISDDREWRLIERQNAPGVIERLTDREYRDLASTAGLFRRAKLTSSGFTKTCIYDFVLHGRRCSPFGGKSWLTTEEGMLRLEKASRLFLRGKSPYSKQYFDDFPVVNYDNSWQDQPAAQARVYVVQTAEKFIERCMLMTTDPGDLVLDPTCGSGTTALVAEQWGRRWITTDTSRVAIALARARIMGSRFQYYLLTDSKSGQVKEAELSRTEPSDAQTNHDIRHGFVYQRVPHITLRSIANNSEIDVIWERFQETLEPLREKLNKVVGKTWEEWEIPREVDNGWSAGAKKLHADWWKQRIARQKEIDASIAAKADFEYLYDKPYEDKRKVRVAGPFTVESLSPHRTLHVGADDELIDPVEAPARTGDDADFASMILENLKSAGVQQAHKEDKITFSSIAPWPGHFIAAEGRYVEGENGSETEKRAGIFVGPEFGTVSRRIWSPPLARLETPTSTC